jgi:hypothetical protein
MNKIPAGEEKNSALVIFSAFTLALIGSGRKMGTYFIGHYYLALK